MPMSPWSFRQIYDDAGGGSDSCSATRLHAKFVHLRPLLFTWEDQQQLKGVLMLYNPCSRSSA
jgi:hypothetical protein